MIGREHYEKAEPEGYDIDLLTGKVTKVVPVPHNPKPDDKRFVIVDGKYVEVKQPR